MIILNEREKIERLEYLEDFTKKVFDTYSYVITYSNIIYPRLVLVNRPNDCNIGTTIGNTVYFNMANLLLDNLEYCKYLITTVITHELFHVNQDVDFVRLNKDFEYQLKTECDTEFNTLLFLTSNETVYYTNNIIGYEIDYYRLMVYLDKYFTEYYDTYRFITPEIYYRNLFAFLVSMNFECINRYDELMRDNNFDNISINFNNDIYIVKEDGEYNLNFNEFNKIVDYIYNSIHHKFHIDARLAYGNGKLLITIYTSLSGEISPYEQTLEGFNYFSSVVYITKYNELYNNKEFKNPFIQRR